MILCNCLYCDNCQNHVQVLTTESIFSESAPQIKALVRNPSAFSTLFAPGKSWDNVRSTTARRLIQNPGLHAQLQMSAQVFRQQNRAPCAHLYSLRDPATHSPRPPSRIWAHLRKRYWLAKIDDISLWPLGYQRGLPKRNKSRLGEGGGGQGQMHISPCISVKCFIVMLYWIDN